MAAYFSRQLETPPGVKQFSHGPAKHIGFARAGFRRQHKEGTDPVVRDLDARDVLDLFLDYVVGDVASSSSENTGDVRAKIGFSRRGKSAKVGPSLSILSESSESRIAEMRCDCTPSSVDNHR